MSSITLPLQVGEELMRDSALKHCLPDRPVGGLSDVGEELMRDSALKRANGIRKSLVRLLSEKSSCATAL